jgi:hypothetical protein
MLPNNATGGKSGFRRERPPARVQSLSAEKLREVNRREWIACYVF